MTKTLKSKQTITNEVAELISYTMELLSGQNNKFRRFKILTEITNILETVNEFTELENIEIDIILSHYNVTADSLNNERDELETELSAFFETVK